MSKSQNAQILAHMKRGKTIQPFQALILFRCMRLASRIQDIEEMGYTINDVWIKARNMYGEVKRVKRYSLVR